MKIREENITPAMARKYLERNTHNRSLSQPRVDRYAADIRNGKWKLTASSIQFDKSGKLIDGQHRLHAVVKANKAAKFTVAEDLDEDIFDVIDTGKNRTAGDLVSMSGVKYPALVASIAKRILLFNAGEFNDGGNGKARNNAVDSNHEILKFIASHEGEIESIAQYAKKVTYKFRFFSPPYIGGLYYLFACKHQEKADEFFNAYATGEGLVKGHPVYALREKILKEQGKSRKPSNKEMTAWTIMAWNAFRKNKQIVHLAYNTDLSYPKPI